MSESRDWTGFTWKDERGEYEVIRRVTGEASIWLYIHQRNGVNVGGGSIGSVNLEAIEREGMR